MGFIACFLCVYYILPRKYRYIVLAVGSWTFYGWGNISVLWILLLTTLLTYAGGGVLEKWSSKILYITFFVLNISILLVFKYTNFIVGNINEILERLIHLRPLITFPDFVLPIGLSFYIFQSTTYLGDVYRGKIKAERNFMKYSAFVAFFPAVFSGPIQKSRELLPQISEPADFDSERAIKGFILFVWGVFQKIAVANNLAKVVNTVFDNYATYDSRTNTAYFIVAAISFSFYIYADFSSYSDMARGVAKLLGIEITRNFDNPYLSISCDEFWRRWHISLSEWLTEYVYIPLGGNRKGEMRKYFNVFIVFLISGIWHGALWHYIIWGMLNGIFVIVGQMTRPIKRKVYGALKIDENIESIVMLRRVITFWLITITWVFFRNGIEASLYIIRNIVFFYPVKLFVPELLTICGTDVKTFGTIIMVVIFCLVQYCRKDERRYWLKFKKQPVLMQCMALAIIMYICVFNAAAETTTLNTQFLYFQF